MDPGNIFCYMSLRRSRHKFCGYGSTIRPTSVTMSGTAFSCWKVRYRTNYQIRDNLLKLTISSAGERLVTYSQPALAARSPFDFGKKLARHNLALQRHLPAGDVLNPLRQFLPLQIVDDFQSACLWDPWNQSDYLPAL